MVVDAPVVARQGDGAVPDAGVREVAGSLGQGPAAGALVDLYAQVDGGDLECCFNGNFGLVEGIIANSLSRQFASN